MPEQKKKKKKKEFELNTTHNHLFHLFISFFLSNWGSETVLAGSAALSSLMAVATELDAGDLRTNGRTAAVCRMTRRVRKDTVYMPAPMKKKVLVLRRMWACPGLWISAYCSKGGKKKKEMEKGGEKAAKERKGLGGARPVQ